MDEWIPCWQCEEQYNCPDSERYDGCDCGVKTLDYDEEEDDENE